MSIQALFSDRKYVMDELLRMREVWGNRTTFTRDVIEASQKTLGFMMLYAPPDMINTVEAHMNELLQREAWMLFGRRPDAIAKEKAECQ